MRVKFLATCLVDSLFPEVGEAAVRVLAEAGVEAAFPAEQTCCGQPALNAGYPDQARQLALHTLAVFDGDEPVVVPSGSCAEMVRHRYPELLAGDADAHRGARSLAERTYELTEFLVDKLLISEVGARAGRDMAYHPSCHLLRGLGVDRQPMELLEAIEGGSVERLAADCCGFGGLFAIDHAEISGEMLERTLQRIESSGAELVVGCDASCLMQIEGGLRRTGSNVRTSHLAQALAGQAPGLR